MTTMFNMFSSCFLLVLVTYLSTTPTQALLQHKCNPQDKKALLQIKKDLGNPTPLASWSTRTDCCDNTKPWKGVKCDSSQSNRVNYLSLSDLELHPHPLQFSSSIGNLPFLNFLYITNIPNLMGPIPESFENLTKLRYLTIRKTLMSGAIPEFFSNFKNLVTLDLSYSNICDGIPSSLSQLRNLEGISLDGNWLSGSIPDSFGSFTNRLTSLTLSKNQLSGEIPASLAKLNLAFVDLSRNRFEGDASMLFGYNKRTQKINLSRNRLVFDLGKVGLSKNLEGLDLRNNHIYGKLPEGLTKLKFLHQFNVSYNSLCGEIPKGGNLQRFDASSYVHNKCLCGSPLRSCKQF